MKRVPSDFKEYCSIALQRLKVDLSKVMFDWQSCHYDTFYVYVVNSQWTVARVCA